MYSPDGPLTNRVALELLGWRWKDESRKWFVARLELCGVEQGRNLLENSLLGLCEGQPWSTSRAEKLAEICVFLVQYRVF